MGKPELLPETIDGWLAVLESRQRREEYQQRPLVRLARWWYWYKGPVLLLVAVAVTYAAAVVLILARWM